ncbi:unnamed protein product [Brachionus calyciflorus]|uniref:Uncharacterized protein n=1 Tax=Brachionus calyciflorus TaxID=104777 RepID=A0A814KAL4_9BILA|nr:unnamed protein product [Brachionus calyciflorus]
MNKKTILTITIALILVKLNEINCLKCHAGFGLEPRKYYSGLIMIVKFCQTDYNYEKLECSGTNSTNPFYQPRGCYKFVHKLSDGNEYVEKGCFTGANTLNNISPTYNGKVFTYVCNTDNCNSSTSLKTSFLGVFTLFSMSIYNFF